MELKFPKVETKVSQYMELKFHNIWNFSSYKVNLQQRLNEI